MTGAPIYVWYDATTNELFLLDAIVHCGALLTEIQNQDHGYFFIGVL